MNAQLPIILLDDIIIRSIDHLNYLVNSSVGSVFSVKLVYNRE